MRESPLAFTEHVPLLSYIFRCVKVVQTCILNQIEWHFIYKRNIIFRWWLFTWLFLVQGGPAPDHFIPSKDMVYFYFFLQEIMSPLPTWIKFRKLEMDKSLGHICRLLSMSNSHNKTSGIYNIYTKYTIFTFDYWPAISSDFGIMHANESIYRERERDDFKHVQLSQ